jgi:hypothetical protein
LLRSKFVTTPSDDNPQFAFEIDMLRKPWPDDGLSGSNQRRRRLKENERFGGRVIAQLSRVSSIVSPYANNFRGMYRLEDGRFSERDRVHLAGSEVFDPPAIFRRSAEPPRDLIAAGNGLDEAIFSFSVELEAAISHDG